MARVGGRNSWIAAPVGLICAVIVGALVWLSIPMLPVTAAWMGDTLRRATTPQPSAAPEQTPAQQAIENGAVDCRTLYPDDLWNELTWRAGSLLNQTADPPATRATSFTDAVSPDVLVSCHWRFAAGSISTTLSRVGADAVALAEAAFAGQGFSCAVDDGALACTRTQGGVREEHTLRDGLWLASAETLWHPDEYGSRLDRNVW